MTGFDPWAPEVTVLMDQRSREQGEALGSPAASPAPTRRVVTDIAELRSLTGAEDPSAEEPEQRWVATGPGFVQVTVVVNSEPVLDALRRTAARIAEVIERFGEVLKRAGTSWDEVLAAIAEAQPPPKALERARHGTAAVCPRHGPTKGGLCRRCRRCVR